MNQSVLVEKFKKTFYNIKGLPLQNHIVTMNISGNKTTLSLLENNLDECLVNWDKKKIRETIDTLDQYYYNSSTGGIVSDKCYDKLREFYEDRYGKLNKIGAPLKNSKIKLPVHMGSMDKVKIGSTNLKSFLSNYTSKKCIMDKLDGSSILIDLRDNTNPKAYTRGNGTYGQDVSYKAPFIDGLEHIKKCKIGGIIRGEAIVPINKWQEIQNKGANARNYVAGIINRKLISPQELSNIQFVAYEWINDLKLSISEQLEHLKSSNFNTVRYKIFDSVKENQLPQILSDFKKTSDYEIDGIIVQEDIHHSRNTSGNPKYAKAFKMDELDDSAITTVIDVKWEPSKSGLLKPVVIFNKIHLNGVDIVKSSGYNANFIETNKIGIGSKIKVIRSGGVIPKIVDVIEKKTPALPNIDFNWDSNHTDIVIKDLNNKEVELKKLEYFINTMGISFLKIGMLRKLYDKGCKTIFDLLFLTKDVIMSYKLPGIKDKTATKIADSIKTTFNNTSIDILAASTPYFNGIAKKKMKTLNDNIPNWYKLDKQTLKESLLKTNGFSEISSNNVLDGLNSFKDFYKAYLLSGYTVKNTSINIIKSKSEKLAGNVYLFTGFRDNTLKNNIHQHGGIVVDSLSKKNKITHLVRLSEDIVNSKIQKIMDDQTSNIKIITKNDIQI